MAKTVSLKKSDHYFYYYYRALVCLGKCMCILPLQNVLSSNPFDLKYKRCSCIFFFSIFVQCSLIFFVIYCYWLRIQVSTTGQKLLFILLIIMMVRVILSWSLCLFMMAKRMPCIIQLLETFVKQRRDLLLIDKPNHEIFFKIVLPCTSLILFAMVYSYGIYSATQDIFPKYKPSALDKIASYTIGFVASGHVIPIFYFLYLSSSISRSFHEINKTLKIHKFTPNYQDLFTHCPQAQLSKELAQWRRLHSILQEATVELCKGFGGILALEKVFIVVFVVGNLSCYLFSQSQSIAFIVMLVVNLLLARATIDLGQNLMKRGKKVARLFQGIPSESLSEKTKEEIQLWLLQLTSNPIHVDAAGYFQLDKSQTFEVLSSIATYLIVAVQLLEDESSKTSVNGTS
ncbi:uncharacterized protein LOC126739296 [Anthonomus grandis grandis]|uniref:uncharacterized protein LOC126739296 n=1 Tax=Anthonomus grandis grandis TaxID=2921223 RepID=UPI0021669623|nr:uncharacterized protein LOC126739296 [Anthonomus grandis grandis]